MAQIKVTLNVGGMRCAACVSAVEKALLTHPGVASATVDLDRHRAAALVDATLADASDLVAAVEDAGYEASIADA